MYGLTLRSLVLVILLFDFVLPLAAEPDIAPPTAIKWELDDPTKATPGPAPQIIRLNAPISYAGPMDVDEYGRIYVLDYARKTLTCFNSSGELERTWQDGVHDSSCPCDGRQCIKVFPDGMIFLGSSCRGGNIRRISPSTSDDAIVPIDRNEKVLTSAPDGSFYSVNEFNMFEKDFRIYAHNPDGSIRKNWSTPPLNYITLGPDGLLYATKRLEPKIAVYDTNGNLQREIDLTWLFGTDSSSHETPITIDTNGDIYLRWFYFYRLNSQGQPLARWRAYRTSKTSCWSDGSGYPIVRNGLVYTLMTMSDMVEMARDGSNVTYTSSGKKQTEIQVFTPDGQCVTRYLSEENRRYDLPTAIAVQSDGTYAIAQYGLSNVLVFDKSNNPSDPVPGMSYPRSIAAKPGGGFYETYAYNGLVLVDNKGKLQQNII
jgi:hypothetical protein